MADGMLIAHGDGVAGEALARADPEAFVDLRSRTDALYFTIATLGTVGFGDVHAVSTAARALVTIQMVFDLTYLAVIVRLLSVGVGHRSAPASPPRSVDGS